MHEADTDVHGAEHDSILALLHAAADREASDVHLVAGHAVTYRVHGRLEPVGDALAPDELRGMIESILPERMAARGPGLWKRHC